MECNLAKGKGILGKCLLFLEKNCMMIPVKNKTWPKIIIIEGVDKTGKSTLAKKVSEETGYPVVHLGVPPDKGYYRKLRRLINKGKEGVIFDRFHWGDVAYHGITREKRALTPEEFTKIEGRLDELGAVVIYCHSGFNAIWRRFKEDKEELINPESIPIIQEQYRKIIALTPLRVMLHDFKNFPIEITKLYGSNT